MNRPTLPSLPIGDRATFPHYFQPMPESEPSGDILDAVSHDILPVFLLFRLGVVHGKNGAPVGDDSAGWSRQSGKAAVTPSEHPLS